MLIVKRFEFEMSHCLDGHERGCNNCHGHSYKLEVGYQIDPREIIKEGSSEGMGIDFGDLKKKVNELIVDKYDHSFIYNISNENEVKIAELLQKLGKKTNRFIGRTTCENMARDFLGALVTEDRHFSFIRLYETSGSYVEVGLGDLW